MSLSENTPKATASIESVHARLLALCPTLATRLTPEAALRASGLDSLEFVELLCAIEAGFQIRLTTDDLTPETTVNQVCALILTRLPRIQNTAR